MVFKLVTAASKTWRRLNGQNQLPKSFKVSHSRKESKSRRISNPPLDSRRHPCPHQAMSNQMPMDVWRAGIEAIEAAGKRWGYAASLGQRKRVAHIPTAEAAEKSGLKSLIEERGQTNLHRKSNGPSSHVPLQEGRDGT
jgi:hypothetical protein